jgi:translocation and assembly module TamB
MRYRAHAVTRVLAWAGRGLLWATGVVGVVVTLVLLLLDTAPARNLALHEVNALLASQFQGRVVVTRLAHLGLGGVSGVDGVLASADGRPVAAVQGITARIAPLRILKSVVFGKGDIDITVDRLIVDQVDLSLRARRDGSLELVHVFDPKGPASPPSEGGRGVAIALPDAELTHAWAHGVIPKAPPIDADVANAKVGFLSSSAATKLEISHVSILARGLLMGAVVSADVQGSLTIPAAEESPMLVRVAVDGRVGEVPLTASLAMRGDALDATVDLPEVSAEAVRSSLAGLPVHGVIGAHATLRGSLADLALGLRARVGDGSLDAIGTLDVKGRLSGHVTIKAEHVDAQTFSPSSPSTDLGATVDVDAGTDADQTLTLSASIDLPGGRVASQTVPHTVAHATVTGRAGNEGGPPVVGARLSGTIDEPGAPVAFTADGRSEGGRSSAVFAVRAETPRLEEFRRFGALGSGDVTLTLSGVVRVGDGVHFEAKAEGQARGLDVRGIRARDVHLVASAEGLASSPSFRARLWGADVEVGTYRYSGVDAAAGGVPSAIDVSASLVGAGSPDLVATGVVSLAPTTSVRAAKVVIKRGGDALELSVQTARVERGVVDVSGLALRGAGDRLEASGRISPSSVRVKARTASLDLSRLAAITGQKDQLGGKLALDLDVSAAPDRARGKVAVGLEHGRFLQVKDVDAHLDLALDGRRLTGDLRGGVAEAGSLVVRDIDVHVGGGGPVSVRGWREAWGKVRMFADVDLAKVAALLPPGAFHVSDVAGRVTLEGELARDSLEDTTPEVRLAFATTGLSALGEAGPPIHRPGGPYMVGPPTWTLSGVDARGTIVIDGESSDGELAVQLVDRAGPLLAVDVKTGALPFGNVFSARSGLAPALERTPVAVRVEMPPRELGGLPLLVRPEGIRGEVGAVLTVEGSADHPNVGLDAHGAGLVVAAAGPSKVKLDVSARYDGARAKAHADVGVANASVMRADAEATLPVADLLEGRARRWVARASAALDRFPLSLVSVLSANQVKGFATGKLEVTGVHEDGRAAAELDFAGLSLGNAKLDKGAITATLDGTGLLAKARFDSADGFLEANAKMGMKWGAAVAPAPDGSGVTATLDTKHFPVAAAAPFVAGAVSDLSGWLDASAKVILLPGRKPTMSGVVAVSDGMVDVPSLGESFHAVTAKVALADDGTITLDDVSASGVAGRLTATGSAHLDGLHLTAADVALDIDKQHALALDVQGSNLGTVYGRIHTKVTGASDGSRFDVAVDVPDFHVDMPASGIPRSPQKLGDTAGVHVGVYRTADRFVLLPRDTAPVATILTRNREVAGLPSTRAREGEAVTRPQPGGPSPAAPANDKNSTLAVTVTLGDVTVTRGQQATIEAGGEIRANIADAVVVRGVVHMKSGKLDVQSKEFDIKRGTVSFVGTDPSDPEVNVTAEWTAPDGTQVFADYVGPVKTGKVDLRSEPPRPKNEIVSLILFGTADGSASTPYASKSPSTGTQAGTTVGGLATDGLSKGLDQLTGMNVTTKIDTSDSANPRPEVEVQIARDVSLEFAFVIGTPPPGQNPDTTFATIDWRFARNWSLATTFGDEGSTFADLVWAHRY